MLTNRFSGSVVPLHGQTTRIRAKEGQFPMQFSQHLVSAEGRRFTIVREGIDQIFADFACNLHFCSD